MWQVSYRSAKRIAVFVVGATVVLIGTVLLVLPGPGLLVIFLGLSILAGEFLWARAWLNRLRSGAAHAARRARRWRFWRRDRGRDAAGTPPDEGA